MADLTDISEKEKIIVLLKELGYRLVENPGINTENALLITGGIYTGKYTILKMGFMFFKTIFKGEYTIVNKVFRDYLETSPIFGEQNQKYSSYEKARLELGEKDYYLIQWSKKTGLLRCLLISINFIILEFYNNVNMAIGLALMHCWMFFLLIFSSVYYLYYLMVYGRPKESDKKREFFKDFFDYFFESSTGGSSPFFLYKALEAYQYRKYVKNTGDWHPNLEVGFWDGRISAFHLGDVEYFDYGLEIISGVKLVSNAPVYKNIVHFPLQKNNWPSSQFKAIYMVHVVDHFDDLDCYLNEAYRILQKNGKIYLSGNGGLAFGDPYNNYTISEWIKIFRKHNFVIEYITALQTSKPAVLSFNIPEGIFNIMRKAKIFIDKLMRIPIYKNLFLKAIYYVHLPLFLMDEEISKNADKGVNFFAILAKK